ncbi:MAG TPA: thioesterase family protein [Thermoanaerobaculia bacterium]|nr:thioesterase family protein [Thermoanaerobaculia bacterium]
MPEPVRAEIDVEVRYAETDQMGIVHHANYVIWFELARTNLCALSGFHYAEIERMGYLLTVTGVSARYRRPARYGDTVRVASWGGLQGSRGVWFSYEVHRGDELLTTGASEHVWLDKSTGRPCRIPEACRETFERLAGKTVE